jgi:hypothetical protein
MRHAWDPLGQVNDKLQPTSTYCRYSLLLPRSFLKKPQFLGLSEGQSMLVASRGLLRGMSECLRNHYLG